MNPKLEICETGRHGKGIFTSERITAREYLLVSGGYIVSVDDEEGDYGGQVTEDFVMTTRIAGGDDCEQFNHSCNPNAGIKGQIVLVAMRDIQAGEEITFDYAMCLYSPSDTTDGYEMKCQCGAENCRGVVTDRDWLLPDLQQHYNGYFSWFIQEKIDRMNI